MNSFSVHFRSFLSASQSFFLPLMQAVLSALSIQDGRILESCILINKALSQLLWFWYDELFIASKSKFSSLFPLSFFRHFWPIATFSWYHIMFGLSYSVDLEKRRAVSVVMCKISSRKHMFMTWGQVIKRPPLSKLWGRISRHANLTLNFSKFCSGIWVQVFLDFWGKELGQI